MNQINAYGIFGRCGPWNNSTQYSLGRETTGHGVTGEFQGL